ncbi:hypothetical protein [Rhodococcus sp. SGAir0479]|nr:hypothetical protein [Rhodococcus sp. SGAir0479]
MPTTHRRYDELFHGFTTLAARSATQDARKPLQEDQSAVPGGGCR